MAPVRGVDRPGGGSRPCPRAPEPVSNVPPCLAALVPPLELRYYSRVMTHLHEDFASAALRHIRDAEHLLAPNEPHRSPDQAWHLAGFAHECARKACLKNGWVPKLLGHGFSASSEEVVELAIALDPRAGRFPVRDWAARHPAVANWRPDHRYERTGTTAGEPGRQLGALVVQARQAVDSCVLALLIDGSLDRESLR